ncbi:MAG: AraC family transcriptional regulator [Ponticaulis sp.]|nr:AraC family transcriptional regulator [Ponticaulis sp.]|tara:strand:- start:31846 stop:32865 length:1020 start_codon:yes stop_codon:yes gene_type:complete
MGLISSLFVHKTIAMAVEGVANADAARNALLQSVGLDPAAAIDPKLMVPDTDYYALCERLADHYPGQTDLTMRVGGSMTCDDYRAFGLAWKSAPTLRASYDRAERYGRMLTSVSTYELKTGPSANYFIHHRAGTPSRGMGISNEQTLAAIVAISREVCAGPFAIRAVHFKHERPEAEAAHQAYFDCPIMYGASMDALEFTAEVLDLPNRLGDEALSRFFETHLEQELASLEHDIGLEHRVRIQISHSLSGGIPTLHDIALALGLSARSLQRRLSEKGLSFQTLIDASRRELAMRLLQTTEYSLAEIAFLTGFSEQSAFTRAFKRWAGQTPRNYRLEVKS